MLPLHQGETSVPVRARSGRLPSSVQRTGLGVLAAALLASTAAAQTVPQIHLDPKTTYQTITGWEATADAAQIDTPAWPLYQNELLDRAVYDLGLTRLRLEVRAGAESDRDYWQEWQDGLIPYSEWRSHRYATVDDDFNRGHVTLPGFHFSELENTVEQIVLPFRDRMRTLRDPFHLNLCYVAFTNQNAAGTYYVHIDPVEYTEFVFAVYATLKLQYGITPDTWEVLLEPDNVSEWSGTDLGRAIVLAGTVLRILGEKPAFVAPSTSSVRQANIYFDEMIQLPRVRTFLSEFAYHRYFGATATHLSGVRARADQYKLKTAQLEYIGADYNNLHEDLKLTQVSSWAQYSLAALDNGPDIGGAYFLVDDSDPTKPVLREGSRTPFLRQYFHYVRPGAVRIEATSGSVSFDPVAFVNANGKYAVVIKATAGGSIDVAGLPAGVYGIEYTTAAARGVTLPNRAIISGQLLRASIPDAGVVTVFER